MLSVGVVGAGIGGLTAALALREAGFHDVHVYEAGEPGSAPAAGLVLSPNATRVLLALGLKNELQSLGRRPEFQLQRTWRNGFLLAQRPLGQFAEARYGAPHCIVDRSALLGTLLEACVTRAVAVTGNAFCSAISQRDGRAIVEFDGRRASHDVLIGCDGTESVVRRSLHYPPATTSSGRVWWGSTPSGPLPRPLTGNAVTTWLGPGQYLTHWPSPDGNRVDFLAVVPDARPDLATCFASWHEHVGALISGSESLSFTSVNEHSPITQWYDRCVVLLGDACHALPPHLQQGAALAIEDAWVLSRMLERWEDEPNAGFEEYQRYRKVRLTRMRRASRFYAAQWACDGHKQTLTRNLKLSVVSRFLPEIAMQQLDWLYGYDCVKGFE